MTVLSLMLVNYRGKKLFNIGPRSAMEGAILLKKITLALVEHKLKDACKAMQAESSSDIEGGKLGPPLFTCMSTESDKLVMTWKKLQL